MHIIRIRVSVGRGAPQDLRSILADEDRLHGCRTIVIEARGRIGRACSLLREAGHRRGFGCQGYAPLIVVFAANVTAVRQLGVTEPSVIIPPRNFAVEIACHLRLVSGTDHGLVEHLTEGRKTPLLLLRRDDISLVIGEAPRLLPHGRRHRGIHLALTHRESIRALRQRPNIAVFQPAVARLRALGGLLDDIQLTARDTGDTHRLERGAARRVEAGFTLRPDL